MSPRSPRARRRLAAAVCLLALGVAGGGAAFAGTLRSQSSTNWAGWVALAVPRSSNVARHFVTVRGSWVQPSATCTPHHTTFAAFWVGLGGYSSNELEQIGTEADCSKYGQLFYYAWYELLPGPPITIKAIKVIPGDAISAYVHVSSYNVTVGLADLTSGAKQFVKTAVMRRPPPDTSAAEWIAEVPSINCDAHGRHCKVLRLTNFGQLGFTSSSATSIGSAGRHTGPIDDPAWDHDSIVLSSSGALHYTSDEKNYALPSLLSANGSAFTIVYGAGGPSGPTGPTGSTGTTGSTGSTGATGAKT